MNILDIKGLGSGIESVDIDSIMEELERRKGDDARIVTSIVPGKEYPNMNRHRSRPINHPSWNGRLEAEVIDTREDEMNRFMCGR
ncbi:hypothetical protein HQ587_06040 [bacterium]|nr:hypothetical protein [bacterium]